MYIEINGEEKRLESLEIEPVIDAAEELDFMDELKSAIDIKEQYYDGEWKPLSWRFNIGDLEDICTELRIELLKEGSERSKKQLKHIETLQLCCYEGNSENSQEIILTYNKHDVHKEKISRKIQYDGSGCRIYTEYSFHYTCDKREAEKALRIIENSL